MPRLKWHFVVFIANLVVLVSLTSCNKTEGPDTVPVTGVVTLDGKAVEGAQVVFVPAGSGRAASGVTNATGQFTLTTLNPQDGAVVGNYQVTIAKVAGDMPSVDLSGLSEEEANKKAAEAYYSSEAAKNVGNPKQQAKATDLLPAKYKDAAKSELKAEVKAGQENKFDFKLTSGA